ncbi:MAG: DegV family protein [Lachnospiraceae bacterium]|nr:DegV family protein [Lachnospiraceae bacterium]
MREFVITTDSNSDLALEYIEENHIGIIPHYYMVEEEVYGGGRELTIKEFYDAMRQQKKVGTMASNPAVIEETFLAYEKEGKDVLHISFSSALSGGCSNVQVVASQVMEEHPQMKIVVIDTLSVSLGEALMIMKAVALKKEGKSLEETVESLEQMIPHLCVQFTVDDLNHLYRGGRLSKTSAILGTVVNIKPILYVDEAGKLVALSKVRGRKKALNTLADNLEDRLGSFRDQQIAIGIVHGDCEEDALYLKQMLKERFGFQDFLIGPVGPSIGAHSGPGALGLIFLGQHR